MPIGLTYKDLSALNPCADTKKSVAALFGGAVKWGNRSITADEARAAGVSFDNIVWAASAVSRSNPDVERRLRLWTADCAARVLHIYEKTEISPAPRNAVIASRQFARGEITDAAWATARDAAWAAARSVTMDAARAAARNAALAAARDAIWDAAWDTAEHAAKHAAGDTEEAWQFDRLIARLSDEELEDWPLPAIKQPAAA